MPRTLVRHGTNAGYRAELDAGNEPCNRCRNARRVFQTQYTKAGRAKGLKYKSDQVIDHLYQNSPDKGQYRKPAAYSPPVSRPSDVPAQGTGEDDTGPYTVGVAPSRPSLSDRIKALAVGTGEDDSNEYVSDNEYPDYITPDSVDPDPDPEGQDYSAIPNDSAEFVINAAGMAKIEDSLGTYLSIFGITMEMVDPYCGPILAQNMDNIVRRWSKVIAKYPKAAELFMDGKGGTLMAWITAIQATWPFLFALYEHHFSKNVQTSGGQIYRKNNEQFNGQWPQDATTPDFQYTAG